MIRAIPTKNKLTKCSLHINIHINIRVPILAQLGRVISDGLMVVVMLLVVIMLMLMLTTRGSTIGGRQLRLRHILTFSSYQPADISDECAFSVPPTDGQCRRRPIDLDISTVVVVIIGYTKCRITLFVSLIATNEMHHVKARRNTQGHAVGM